MNRIDESLHLSRQTLSNSSWCQVRPRINPSLVYHSIFAWPYVQCRTELHPKRDIPILNLSIRCKSSECHGGWVHIMNGLVWDDARIRSSLSNQVCTRSTLQPFSFMEHASNVFMRLTRLHGCYWIIFLVSSLMVCNSSFILMCMW